ncbi:phosphonate C-P lyase system protein PhnH [Maritimibacter sp. UBA3975]|uniref:phosphonate C-P lyase system protein PhnH n=1 Tax=Maritimibacter sp. UBA3975 TaxID=1946833 RepID=UPI000C09E147|nr:phosphonate C-P lyase system protein PhnH [Maritimibacter sp. UBA3975]MAM63164.1 phosphonate C-P lyase system protein PhnH [Maritimibacter sp.]|tara:strand:+ start:37401 stop:37970 length:570 start_codon:yes stop_codon:yes gene_type:complete
MDGNALTGGFADAPVQSAHAFRAALNALARPGRIERISGAEAPAPVSPAAATLLLTLCDAETPLHLAGDHDKQPVRDWIAFHIGAPLVGRSHAMFALGTWPALTPLDAFPVGTPEYPDRSTTLIVEMDALAATGARLTGPGIETEAHLALPDIAPFRANHARFPLGLDSLFTAGDRIAGLPRSTNVEAG